MLPAIGSRMMAATCSPTSASAAETVRDWKSAATCDTERYARYFKGMLDRGITLAPSQFEATFVGLAHSDADIITMTDAAAEVLAGL